MTRKIIGALLIAAFLALSVCVVEAGQGYLAAHLNWDNQWWSNWLIDHVTLLEYKSVGILAVVFLLPGAWLLSWQPQTATRFSPVQHYLK